MKTPNELPEPPWRVYAWLSPRKPQWWFQFTAGIFQTRTGRKAHYTDLHVVEHPRNDPEAVEMIEPSKRRETV